MLERVGRPVDGVQRGDAAGGLVDDSDLSFNSEATCAGEHPPLVPTRRGVRSWRMNAGGVQAAPRGGAYDR